MNSREIFGVFAVLAILYLLSSYTQPDGSTISFTNSLVNTLSSTVGALTILTIGSICAFFVQLTEKYF
jgi:hypothetical protein